MYDILKIINDTTKLAMRENMVYILKRIIPEELPVCKKLIEMDHPNIVRIYETVIIDNDLYIVEEFIQGITLESYIKQNGTLDDSTVRDFTLAICSGLSEIHNLGIIHRDINPNNIMIDQNGSIKIIDFGISRLEKEKQDKDTQILGTRGYAAPEQYGFHQTHRQADIYAVGALINYMKTMQLPNERLVGGLYQEIVLKCTQIDENKRYADVGALAGAIHKKYKFARFIRSVPGFRKGKWQHLLIASVYYLVLLLLLFLSVVTAYDIKDGICAFCCFFFALGVPIPILCNFNGWLNKLSLICNKNKSEKAVIQILLCVLCEIIACIFILLDS